MTIITKESIARQEGNTVTYDHNTAVQTREGDALIPALQRARNRVTPHGSLFVDKPNSRAGWKLVAKQARAETTTCPSSKLYCRECGASSQANGSARL